TPLPGTLPPYENKKRAKAGKQGNTGDNKDQLRKGRKLGSGVDVLAVLACIFSRSAINCNFCSSIANRICVMTHFEQFYRSGRYRNTSLLHPLQAICQRTCLTYGL